MVFLTRREFEEEVNKRIDMVMHNREQEDRYWRLMERIEKLESKIRRMEETTEVKIKEDLIPLDNAFMEHG